MCGILASICCPKVSRENGLQNGNGVPPKAVNGHGTAATNTNGHGVNGHAVNGHAVNGHAVNGHAVNGNHKVAEPQAGSELREQLVQGVDGMMKHRGPDGYGVWVSEDAKAGIAHCRLSINDLSPEGSQPLHSDDGGIHAVVNGEIYDHDRLRAVCSKKHGYTFASHSDSELVVALYKIHGAPAMFEHLRGEFAFVLIDERSQVRRTIAGRDRFGIKPLFWTVSQGRVLLAAEAKAFIPMGWQPEWDIHGLVDHGWLVDDRSIFKGVKKVLPGHWMEITDESGIQMNRYWDAEYPDKNARDPRTEEEMVAGVRERLVESIRLRMQADVPVGVYLSGGIDSSAVAGIVTNLAREKGTSMGSAGTSKVSCFSIQFGDEAAYDETSIAQRTAEWLGVDLYKVRLDEEKLAEYFEDAAYHCEHHHFDLNSVAKFALSDFASRHGVKVVLTGEGSDEHFCGYPSFAIEYLREPDLATEASAALEERGIREKLGKAAYAQSRAAWRRQASAKDSEEEAAQAPVDMSKSLMAESILGWQPPKNVYQPWTRADLGGDDWDTRKTLMAAHRDDVLRNMSDKWHPGNSAMYLWNKSILPNVLLACLGDRTEMAHSLEGRTPFLDHHLAEYLNGLPPSMKLKVMPPSDDADIDKSASVFDFLSEKWILREAARPYITDELYNRKKVTFWAPTNWPKGGPLHTKFSSLLSRENVEALGFVDHDVIEKALDAAFGDSTDGAAFRTVCYAAGWVTISRKFGVKRAHGSS